VVADLISRVKDGEPVDWRYDMGEDVYVITKAPQLTIHIPYSAIDPYVKQFFPPDPPQMTALRYCSGGGCCWY
jgi:hypothetical protein